MRIKALRASAHSRAFIKHYMEGACLMDKYKIGETAWRLCQTPIGTLRIAESEKGIISLRFDAEDEGEPEAKGVYLDDACRQVQEYFAKKRVSFDLPLDLRGSEFQCLVWSELQRIPYGETRSYQELAETVGNPKAARAVGLANNRNPIPIIIPCHRVIGKDKKLVGYAGGTERKKFLLELEQD